MIKVLTDESPESVRDLFNESRVLWAVGHPLVRLPVKVGYEGELPALVMEYVEGRPLDEVPPTPALIDRVLREVGDVLHSVHDAGIVHGDIKPANLIVTPGGAVQVIDFGLSRAIHGTPGVLGVGQAVGGSPVYMAPEVLWGGPPTPEADWYSLGVVLSELVDRCRGLSPDERERRVAAIAPLRQESPEHRELPERPVWLTGSPPPVEGSPLLRESLASSGPRVLLVAVTHPSLGGLRRLGVFPDTVLVSRCYAFDDRAYGGLDWLEPLLDLDEEPADWLATRVREHGLESVVGTIRAALERKENPVVLIEGADDLGVTSQRLLRHLLATSTNCCVVLQVDAEHRPALAPLLGQADQDGFAIHRIALQAHAYDEERVRGLSLPDRTALEILAIHPNGLHWPTLDAIARTLEREVASRQRLALRGTVRIDGSGRVRLASRGLALHLRRTLRIPEMYRRAIVAVAPDDEGSTVHLAALGQEGSAYERAMELGRAAGEVGDHVRATQWFRNAMAWAPSGSDVARLALAESLERDGLLAEAAEHYEALDLGHSAARCWLNGGNYERGARVVRTELDAAGIQPVPGLLRTAYLVMSGLLRLAFRTPKPDPALESEKADLRWLLARGQLMVDPLRALAHALGVVHERRASVADRGQALAFVGGGVFLQVPQTRRLASRTLSIVEDWTRFHPPLRSTLDLWSGIAHVSRGEWAEAEAAVGRAYPSDTLETDLQAICQLWGLRHRGDFNALVDTSFTFRDRAARRGDERMQSMFGLFAVDGYLARGQFLAAERAVDISRALLPQRFTPQHFDLAESVVNLALARGKCPEALDALLAIQGPFSRSGGNLAPMTRFRNAYLLAKVGILCGSDKEIALARTRLAGMERADAAALERWLMMEGDTPENWLGIARALEDAGACALASCARLHADDETALADLRRRGVADPAAWATWALPRCVRPRP